MSQERWPQSGAAGCEQQQILPSLSDGRATRPRYHGNRLPAYRLEDQPIGQGTTFCCSYITAQCPALLLHTSHAERVPIDPPSSMVSSRTQAAQPWGRRALGGGICALDGPVGKMSAPYRVMHGVEEVLYPAIRVPGRLRPQETEVLTALSPGGGALRAGQGSMGRALRGFLWSLARFC